MFIFLFPYIPYIYNIHIIPEFGKIFQIKNKKIQFIIGTKFILYEILVSKQLKLKIFSVFKKKSIQKIYEILPTSAYIYFFCVKQLKKKAKSHSWLYRTFKKFFYIQLDKLNISPINNKNIKQFKDLIY